MSSPPSNSGRGNWRANVSYFRQIRDEPHPYSRIRRNVNPWTRPRSNAIIGDANGSGRPEILWGLPAHTAPGGLLYRDPNQDARPATIEEETPYWNAENRNEARLAEKARIARWMMPQSEMTASPNMHPEWRLHHDYFLWACRGDVEEIASQMQAVYAFSSPLNPSFIAERLSGPRAFQQISFLLAYLPGETRTLQRAIARGILYEANLIDPEITYGRRLRRLRQFNCRDPRYSPPVMPPDAPPLWRRYFDAFLLMFLGVPPHDIIIKHGWLFPAGLSVDFLRVRLSQLAHIGLSNTEVTRAFEHRKSIVINRGSLNARRPRGTPRGPSRRARSVVTEQDVLAMLGIE
ncbi:hypothetical protein ASPWEDRAFT_170214 [Aspergillus wentii DTO 134E9]|uniref:Uncharacterized protein n=1 Tax=Aspergillus wentii DTO 134E9 TaxID=1073089 RepID=A0A1L9RPA4_ASPWE|nr:uncharacterized protein ASPWEDRAFT_170214 [Aspergillus wentii DTO 134E9]KAI9934158.1 hypothetical protein MW887_005231 [Aspergillus wentii]OJJ36703.1 hypothetical protein ASPWEDRAFT_170214 [Aspergillus wentii DTO 134E9]